MSEVPQNLRYTKTHEWARPESDGTVTVGITDHAQSQLGDLVYVELPQSGTTVAAGKECAVVESVKAASDLYAPVGGQIAEVNAALSDAPEKVNKDPYGEGWILRIKVADKSELSRLLDAKGYEQLLATEEH
jgi:glycine cleavage system H protein